MAIPVPIPSGALPITDPDTARAEALVAVIAQIFKSGTSGGTPAIGTPATILSDGLNPIIDPLTGLPKISPLVIDTPQAQLFYRQLGLALATALVPYASATVIGVTRLSTDPSAPEFPTALNSEEVTTTPGANKVPRALPSGLLDPAWITGLGPVPPITEHTFTGTCLAGDAVGDLMYVSGAALAVTKADVTNFVKLPAVGCIVSKPSATSCIVQTSGLVSGVYSGLTPGKLYVVGTNSRPTLTLPTPGVGSSLFLQGIGIAIDTNLLLMSPASQITKRIG